MLKAITLFSFILFLLPQKGTSQFIEEGEFEFCSLGWNEICLISGEEIQLENDAIVGQITLSNVDFFGTFDLTFEDGCLRFFFDQEIQGVGFFSLYAELGNGIGIEYANEYTTIDCHNYDYLILPPGNNCGSIFEFKPNEDVAVADWGSPHYQVCQGDTTHITLSPTSFVTTDLPNQLFTADRLCLNNGYIINVEDYSFDIVWETPGTDSLGLITSVGSDLNLLTGHTIFVKESTQLVIEGPIDGTNNVQICTGERIVLSSTSETAQNLEWQVSDGRTFTGIDIDLQFDLPGIYTITLTENDICACSAPAEYTVEVLGGGYADIDCTGTTCEGNTHIYHSTVECDTYLWSVSPEGTITDGGGPNDYFIEVSWNSGPEGNITLSTPGCFTSPCRETTTAAIPIISNDLTIEGPTRVCAGTVSSYSIPNYEGTNINWLLFGDGLIISGHGTNRIIVRWQERETLGSAILSVSLDNCVLGCSSTASTNIETLPEYTVTSNNFQACIDQFVLLETVPSTTVNWTITSPSGNVINISNQTSVSESFSEFGEYTVETMHSGTSTCNQEAGTSITVAPPPSPPTGIVGPNVVCKNVFSSYTVSGLSGIDQVLWQVFDGTTNNPSFTTTSRSLQYEWTSNGPYQISAQIIDGQTGCVSDTETYPFLDEYSLVGSPLSCIYGEEQYTLNNYMSGEITWSIDPSDAGTILTQSGSNIVILWQEEGNHNVQADHCSSILQYSVTIIDLDVNLDFPPEICPDELSTLTILNTTVSPEIRDAFGNIVSTSLTSNLPAGLYTIDMIDNNGCEDFKEIEISEFIEIDVDIDLFGSSVICPPSTTLLTSAVIPTGSYSYQWFRDGVPITGAFSDTYNADQQGSYRVEITDINGCVDLSNGIFIQECCGANTSPPVDNLVTIDSTNITCYTKEFEVIAPFLSTVFNWEIENLTYPNTYFYSGNPITHTFDVAGVYEIRAFGNQGCTDVDIFICGNPVSTTICEFGKMALEIDYVADFDSNIGCTSDTTFFTNESSILNTLPGLQYSWDFGDPTSGPDNFSTLENPTHVYNTDQDYVVTLELFDPSVGCVSTHSSTISTPPLPDSDFSFTQESCLGLESEFNVLNPDPLVNYIWNFGDTISGKNTKAYGEIVDYKYVHTSAYDVMLTAINQRGCQSTTTHTLSITENNVDGVITSDQIYPMCPGEIATLTSTNTDIGNIYLWSTNETSSTISVNTPDSYSLTITNSAGCIFSPSPHIVTIFDIGDAKIFGTKRLPSQELITTEDSMVICAGDYAEIMATTVLNASYTWNITDTNSFSETIEGQKIPFFPHFNSLPVGYYEYNVEIRDTISNCSRIIGPYFIRAVERPDMPIIESSEDELCTNENITLSVIDPQPGITYTWSTGEVGTSIVVNFPNSYYVTASSIGGCIRQSSSINLRNASEASDWMTGCLETCFPMEICINYTPFLTYELIFNGQPIGAIDPNDTTLILNEPGDYQVQTMTSRGCTAITEPLSLSAMPDDHNLEGIVYLDINEDNTYDLGDSLLSNVPVYTCNGNTPIDTTITDINGSYSFSNLPYANMTAKVDPSALDFFLMGPTDSLLIYNDCLEDKIVDFLFTSACSEFIVDTLLMVCPNETIMFNNNTYASGNLDTIVIEMFGDCDSIIFVEVSEFPIPDIDLFTSPTCIGEDNGSIYFDNLGQGSIYYSINNGTIETDTIVNGLTAGIYDVTIYNEANCPSDYQFTIDAMPLPEVMIDAPSICSSDNFGSVSISAIIGQNMQYSIDPVSGFSPDSLLENIPIGDYILYILSDNGCQSTRPFSISALPEPIVDIQIIETCPTEANGSINLTQISGSDLMYSLSSNGPFNSSLSFSDLDVGIHTLYMVDLNGCSYQEIFEVTTFDFPSVDLNIDASCVDEENGQLSINSPTIDIQYNIDQGGLFSDPNIGNLSAGDHVLYMHYINGCTDSLSFIIPELPTPSISIVVQNECENVQGGEITINTAQSGLQYSINDQIYSTDTIIQDLTAGTYDLYVLTTEGCISIIPFEIGLQDEPELSLSVDASCANEQNGSITLENLSGQNLEFAIDDGAFSTDLIFDNLVSGQHTISVQNSIGCIYEYPAEVSLIPLATIEVSINNSCLDDATGTITIIDRPTNSTITLDNGIELTTDEFINVSTGVHSVTIVDSLGCNTETEVEIFPFPDLEVEFPIFDDSCNDSEVEISPEVISSHGNVSFLWSDDSDFESFSTIQPGSYNVIITDECSETQHDWDLSFSLSINEEDLYVPNIFSPNNDGANDCFISAINNTAELLSYHQIIFDRWGNKMFESNDISFCWDGTYNQRPVRPGVFVYITDILVNQCDGPKTICKVGDVTVIR